MKPVWKTVMKWGVLTALLTYVVCMGAWARSRADELRCPGIIVSTKGASTHMDSVTRAGVLDEMARYPNPINGVRATRLDVAAVERYLSRLNNLEEVECAVTSDGHLLIEVESMVPEIRVFTANGDSYYINKDGKRMDAKVEFFADVPVVYGNFTDAWPATSVLPVTRFISSNPDMKTLISAVVARDPDNIILIPRVSGHVINFGDTTRLDRKRAALLTAYRQVLPYRGWNVYDTISVKFRDQIVATRRDKTPQLHGSITTEDIDLEEATLPTVDSSLAITVTAPSPSPDSNTSPTP